MDASEKAAYPSVAVQKIYRAVSELFEQGSRGGDPPREALLFLSDVRDRLWRGVVSSLDSWRDRFAVDWTGIKYGPQYEKMMRLQQDKALLVDVLQQCERQLEFLNMQIADAAVEIEQGGFDA